MKSWEEFNSNDEVMLDRLVDGELNDRERRALLESLDDRPDAWRQCALAFLEAQDWGRTMKGLVSTRAATSGSGAASPLDEPAVSPDTPNLAASALTTQASRLKPQASIGWLAVAASIVVAFALGLYLRGKLFPETQPIPGVEIAETPGGQSPTRVRPADTRMVEQPAGAIPGVHLIDNGPSHDRDSMMVFIDGGPGGQTRAMRLPVVEAGPLENLLEWNGGQAIPPDVIRQLQQQGHQIQRHRRVAPLQLDDGRRMMVPVEDVEIMPVGRVMY